MEYLTTFRREWAPSTTNRKLAAFRAYGRHQGEPNFLATYKAPTVAAGIAHPIPGGIEAVMMMVEKARKPEHRVIIVLCGRLGCRSIEARRVRPKDFSYESDGTILLVHGKGDKTRRVPVPDDVLAILGPTILRTPPDKPLVSIVDRAARRAITRIGRRALDHHVASHDLRMTTGTAFYDQTKDLRATQELLGHASSDTTQGYTGVKISTIRDGLEALHEVAE